jgi:hypothetical protein
VALCAPASDAAGEGRIFHESSGSLANLSTPGMLRGDFRVGAFEASRSIDVVTYGASIAVNGGERFSAGGGIVRF